MSIIPINPTINPNTSDDACCYGHPQAGPGSDAEWLGRGPGWELRGNHRSIAGALSSHG